MTTEFTEALAAAGIAHLCERFGLVIVPKRGAIEMQVAAGVLGLAGVVPSQTFLDHYSTTVGRAVFLAEIPDPWARFGVVAHEAQHAHDADASLGDAAPFVHAAESLVAQVAAILGVPGDPRVRAAELDALCPWSWRMARYSWDRAVGEGRAYSVQRDLGYWRTGELLPLDVIGGSLDHYALGRDGQTALDTLETLGASTVRGGAIMPASRVALAWLDAHWPEGRHAP